jgi:hypothetical protein
MIGTPVTIAVPPNKRLVLTVHLSRAAPGSAPRGTAASRSAGRRGAEAALTPHR